jgi:addiction module RelE/StbE family toxin
MRPLLHHTFKKKFKKLPTKVQIKFEVRLDIFIKNPFDPVLYNHAVGRAYPGCRSINITGDYRAIYQERNETIVFITIGTHPDLY